MIVPGCLCEQTIHKISKMSKKLVLTWQVCRYKEGDKPIKIIEAKIDAMHVYHYHGIFLEE